MITTAAVKSFFEGEQIAVILPTEEEYTALAKYYQITDPKVPFALVRPQNAKEVATAVKWAVQNEVKIIVRSGGGDLFGRSQANEALVIDVRQICNVEVDPDRQTARVGGGCTFGQVTAALGEHALATSSSVVPEIGYVGWATLGGYSPFSAHYGLGVDQIVGAKLIDCNGDLIEADQELLKGIRGAGGNFGVIAELTIKVYRLQKILGGMILFDSSDLESTIQSYARASTALQREGIPDELGYQVWVMNSDFGRTFAVMFVWSSDDHHLGYQWLERVAAMGKEQMRMVKPMTVRELQAEMDKFVVYEIHGYPTSVSVRSISEQVARAIAKSAARLPKDKAVGLTWHELRGNSTAPNPDSVFLAREPHAMVEILSGVEDRSNLEETEAWASEFRSELLQCDGVLPSDYISVTRPDHTSLERLYGSNLDELRQMKKKWDPRGTFDLAVPALGGS